MPVVNFMPQFADLVASGQKNQTIRKLRNRPISVGSNLFLYTGTRTKHSRKLGKAVCTSVVPIHISRSQLHTGFMGHVLLEGKILDHDEENALAKADGFLKFDEFIDFFKCRYGLPFDGVLIRWELENGAV